MSGETAQFLANLASNLYERGNVIRKDRNNDDDAARAASIVLWSLSSAIAESLKDALETQKDHE